MTDLHAYGTFLNEKAEQKALLRTHNHRRRRRRLHSNHVADPSTWMSTIPSSLPISALTLPGTHDSAAYAVMWPFVATQTLTISEQLSAGIRYFDLRCGLVKNTLEMVHGRALLGRTLVELLSSVYEWLDIHPTEALVIQIKQDRGPEDSDVDFARAVLTVLLSARRKWRFTPCTPTLAELRGRIQLFRRFAGPAWAGIPVWKWRDNPIEPFTIHTTEGVEITVQDHYNPTPPAPLSTFVAQKERDVVDMLDRASADKDVGRWYVNFCSAYEFNLYWQASPHDVAVGGWWYYIFTEGINPRLAGWLKAKTGRRRLGVVVLDYPEQPVSELVAQLVATNFDVGRDRWKVSTAAVWAMAMLLFVVFVGGVLVVAIHGPVKHGYCAPFLHACYTGSMADS